MAPIRLALSHIVLGFFLCACQKTGVIDQLSKGRFAVTPDRITVQVGLYCPSAGKTYRDLFVRNFSTLVTEGELQLDSDADGLTNLREQAAATEYNVSPQAADTNGDFFSDFLVYLAGISIPQQTYLRCAEVANIDNDKDGVMYRGQFIGLNNCEETRLTLTDPNKFDTDGDGVTNIEECKFGTPIDESNLSRSVGKFATKYDIQTDAYNNPGCMHIEISNLAVLNGSGSNLVGLYLIEADGNNQLSVRTDWIEVTDGANGRVYTKDTWPDISNSQVWSYVQPR